MSSYVEFKDNRLEIKDLLNEKALAFLYEAKDLLVSQTQRNTPVGTGELKRSFADDSFVDEQELVAYIGSSKEEALWMEMGTGEYALESGRKGGWWIKVGNGHNEIPLTIVQKYGWKKSIKDKFGNITFVFTFGTAPRRMLYKAYQSKKTSIQNRAYSIYKEIETT